MKILYNKEEEKITSGLKKFFKDCNCGLTKPQLNTTTKIMLGMIKSESIVTTDIAKNMTNYSNISSGEKKVFRFFNNDKIDFDSAYENIIRKIINDAKFKQKIAFISLDHTSLKNNFVTLMFTLKINKQCIPIWFYSEKVDKDFKDHEEVNDKKPIYSTEKINYAIEKISSYFENKNVNLIFLADRWFQNTKLFEKINSLGHFYCFRLKQNSKISVTYTDEKTNEEFTKSLSEFKFLECHTLYYKNIKLTSNNINTNLTLGMRKGYDDPYAIATNLDPKLAIKYYNYRFGAIETLFKNTKTAGFNLERTKTVNLEAYHAMYTILSICIVWLVIIGVDYIKNKHHYKNKLNIRVTKKTNTNRIKKLYSDFNLGLTIFAKIFTSKINILLKTNFKLYI